MSDKPLRCNLGQIAPKRTSGRTAGGAALKIAAVKI